MCDLADIVGNSLGICVIWQTTMFFTKQGRECEVIFQIGLPLS